MINKASFGFIALCLFQLYAAAQQEGNIWVFGSKAGLDFSSGSPVPLSTGIDGWEGCASQCNAAGQLLFYTEGRSIWNRNHAVMPNGRDLLPLNPATGSPASYVTTSQQAVIAPAPGYPGRYYVFSLQSISNPGSLYYSIVDMALDGGRGDVVQGQRSVPLDSDLTEKMTAVAGPDCNAWVLVHARSANAYKAYELTAAGLDTVPVVSVCGTLSLASYGMGVMRLSHDGRKLAAACGRQPLGTRGIELCDFDPATGIVSNAAVIDIAGSGVPPTYYYGLAFSPDDSRLYATGNVPATQSASVYQFDLTQATAAAITLSKRTVSTLPGMTQTYDIKAAPDGKLYYMNDNVTTDMHVINFPNLPGLACQPVLNAVHLLPGTQVALGFPNDALRIQPPDTAHSSRTLYACMGDSVLLQADTAGNGHIWDDGPAGDRRVVRAGGTYVAGYQRLCTWYRDSFTVVFPGPFPLPGPDGYACRGTGTKLWCVPRDTGMMTYTWTDAAGNVLRTYRGSAGDTLMYAAAGAYTVHVSSLPGCDTVLRLTVFERPSPQGSFVSDTAVCAGVPLPFASRVPDTVALYWDFGDHTGSEFPDPVHAYRSAGLYRVALVIKNTEGCSDTATGAVRVRDFALQLSADAALVPWRGSVTLQTDAAEPYTVTAWMPAWLFPDQTAYSQQLSADTGRHYMAVGVSAYGCVDTAEVFVDVAEPDPNEAIWIPNAFSPNDDGVNDRFRPVIGSWISVRFRYFYVFDRWGNMVWGTQSHTEALAGWDGTCHGVPADLDVYFYTVEMETVSGSRRILTRKGDFTLMR